MNSILAWFVTFNFVNIAWVFFRAKEWEDAIKVLKGMFGFNGVTLHLFLENKLNFLKSYGVEFKQWLYFIDPKQGVVLILMGFIIVIFGKNSSYMEKYFKPNRLFLLINVVLVIIALFFMNRVSEFLYFNF
jgi:hypothetical protein